MKEITLKAMPILSEPSYRYHILPDGSMVDVYAVNYGCKVDIENKLYLSVCDEGYQECELPTFNDLYAKGIMPEEGSCIEKTYDVDFSSRKRRLTSKDIDSIIQKFKENGFNVTEEAILHNYEAWLWDEKSGYRDEKNGYHLFSPCGCNPLSFRATTLHEKCADWQHTYTY
jgi:hypothetical protein